MSQEPVDEIIQPKQELRKDRRGKKNSSQEEVKSTAEESVKMPVSKKKTQSNIEMDLSCPNTSSLANKQDKVKDFEAHFSDIDFIGEIAKSVPKLLNFPEFVDGLTDHCNILANNDEFTKKFLQELAANSSPLALNSYIMTLSESLNSKLKTLGTFK